MIIMKYQQHLLGAFDPLILVPGFVIQNPTDSDWKLYPQAQAARLVVRCPKDTKKPGKDMKR